MGFQTNTSKDFLILHPRKTPIQGWKWVHHNLSSPIINLPQSPENASSPDLINQTKTSTTVQPAFGSHSASSRYPDKISSPVPDNTSLPTGQPAIAPQSTSGKDTDIIPSSITDNTSFTPITHPDLQTTNPAGAPPETLPVPASTWVWRSPF
ncbi:hypothetical protein K3495_g6482 [Podosphaera aphanis]|nr:hypothetical protein K3495_g6482 [Podosphaera aphanis]